ncbi:Transcriptional regulatory protein (probably LacI-family) [Mycobacterium tuberculosis H37Rv] [Mycobacterium shimoidei]|uniref:Transcriptional regulatory protein (Probably LacI-family) [Mycobacterium tuberculosis H37Rv] n=1 Tax=Mycobacterium shimoidei TaxID=29313 RepID=A0A375YWR1_MYCSH|nr:LacI family DNA-binding transcriptional regulator [Mycobacterium shimoidei]SRX93318.1 Transcriptional regulatory protein (probably LacI-family) [Mycobacterium tuberculosis H37Rv] [Mycobacterium shimoidei]
MSGSPTPRRRATLASLAAELKVSRTTISNAYNRPDQLSPELRERVLAAAKRLGYPGPDPVARSLRTRKAGAVGLLITEPLTYSFRDPAALDFVAGLAQSCEELGQGLMLVAVGPSRTVAEGSASVLAAGVDGFVVYSLSEDDPYLEVALRRRLPVVVVDQPKDVAGASRVGIDDRAAMCELTEHVLALGHREIGLLTMRLRPDGRNGPVDAQRLRSATFQVQSDRVNGVRDAMAAAGIAPESLTVVESYEHTAASGGIAARVALEANPRITALMCTADVLALSAMDYLRGRGIFVPGQISVTGFDGIPEAISRGLTTVAQPSLRKGRRAGELLNSARIGSPVVEMLDTELIRGRTAGPPG